MDREKIVLWVLIVCFVFIVLGFLQVFWIRAKLDSFSKEKIVTEMTASSHDNICPKNNLRVFNTLIEYNATTALNNTSSNEYSIYTLNQKQSVILPYTCTTASIDRNNLKSYKTTLTKPFCLCLSFNQQSFELSQILKTSPLVYLIINSKLYIGSIDEIGSTVLSSLHPESFSNVIIINLYVIKDIYTSTIDEKNVSGCSIDITPFFGSISVSITDLTNWFTNSNTNRTASVNIAAFGISM